MKKLELKSGTVLEVAEGSSKEKLVIICKKFADLDTYSDELTVETLEGATLDGVEMWNVKNVAMDANRDNGGAITCTVSVAYKTDLEILSDRVAETSDAVNALIMGEGAK